MIGGSASNTPISVILCSRLSNRRQHPPPPPVQGENDELIPCSYTLHRKKLVLICEEIKTAIPVSNAI
jgi:hypothetical protein